MSKYKEANRLLQGILEDLRNGAGENLNDREMLEKEVLIFTCADIVARYTSVNMTGLDNGLQEERGEEFDVAA